MSKAAEETKTRSARLKVIRAEMAKAAGYDGELPDDVRERVYLASAMKLQYEVLTAQLLDGRMVDADMMLRLSQGVAAILPPPKSEPLVVDFLGPESFAKLMRDWLKEHQGHLSADDVIARMAAHVSELEADLKKRDEDIGQRDQAISQLKAERERDRERPEPVRPSGSLTAMLQGPQQPKPARGAPAADSPWASVVGCNDHLRSGPYLPPDRFDAQGRRVDEHGRFVHARDYKRDGAT
jgi:hypothetical protein